MLGEGGTDDHEHLNRQPPGRSSRRVSGLDGAMRGRASRLPANRADSDTDP
jgi:hypothetical protein